MLLSHYPPPEPLDPLTRRLKITHLNFAVRSPGKDYSLSPARPLTTHVLFYTASSSSGQVSELRLASLRGININHSAEHCYSIGS